MKVLFLGTNGFPFGMAAVEKQKLIARALLAEKAQVKIVCNSPAYDNFKRNIPYKGRINNIDYIYTSFITKKKKSRLLNYFFFVLGHMVELIVLLFNNYDWLIISTRDANIINRYLSIAKIKGKKAAITVVEDQKGLTNNKNFTEKRKRRIISKYNKVISKTNAVFPISEYLKNQIIEINPSLPMFKLPPLSDFDFFMQKKISIKTNYPYFIFAGSANYFETIKLVIDSFKLVSNIEINLVLVVNGTKNQINKVIDYINTLSNKNKIHLLSGLDYNHLISYYKGAVALLIPLIKNNIDKARFPHKIAEYCACKKPIISTNWGEVSFYFEHRKSALLVENNTPLEIANMMNLVISDKNLSKKLSYNAYKVGIEHFSYTNYGNKILDFLNNIN